METPTQKPKRKGGRKPKYTSETVARIVQAIEQGSYYEHAAAFGGIAAGTFYEWRNSKPEFDEAVRLAESKRVVKWLARIEQAAQDGTWQAAAWKLERCYPHLYGRRITEITGKVEVDIRKMSQRIADELGLNPDEVLEQAEELLRTLPK